MRLKWLAMLVAKVRRWGQMKYNFRCANCRSFPWLGASSLTSSPVRNGRTQMSKPKLLEARNFELCVGLDAKLKGRSHFNFKWPEMKLEVDVRKLSRPQLKLSVLQCFTLFFAPRPDGHAHSPPKHSAISEHCAPHRERLTA